MEQATVPSKYTKVGVCAHCGRQCFLCHRTSRYCSKRCARAMQPRAHGPVDPAARFWSFVDRSGGRDACWPWLLGRMGSGHGRYNWYRGKMVLAHRYAYALEFGSIPAGQRVRHTCDNAPCCNPAHLVLGTQAQNVADMIARGRMPRGEQRPNAKLTPASVRNIRGRAARGESYAQLAEYYGLSIPYVGKVVRRAVWKHVA